MCFTAYIWKMGYRRKNKTKNLPSSVHICTHHSEAYTYMHISDAYIRSYITDVHIYIVLVPQRFSFLFVQLSSPFKFLSYPDIPEAPFWNFIPFPHPSCLVIQRYLRSLFVNLIASIAAGLVELQISNSLELGNGAFCGSRQ